MGIDVSAVARVIGIDAQFRDLRAGNTQFLPQHIALVGHGNTGVVYPIEPFQWTSPAQVAARFGFGSLLHLGALQLRPPTGGGVGSIPTTIFPVAEVGGGVAAVGSIVPSGAATAVATYFVRAAGILSAPFTTAVGDNVAAIVAKMVAACTAVLEMPITAVNGTTDVDVTVKWKGASGNAVKVEVLTSDLKTPVGLTFAVTQPATGASDPDLSAPLAMIGSQWITLIVNTQSVNTIALDDFSAVGEGRWGQLVRRPFVAFHGNNEPVVATATTITNARTTDRVNCQVVAPGSPNLPVQIAAAQVREIAKVANNNPPTDYGSRVVRGLLPGTDAVQWDYAQRDQAVKAGSSTSEVRDGLVHVGDVVTMYHPAGEVPPAYRYVVDIIKLMNVIYNVELEFARPEWDGAPLIPDDQPTVNPNARKPMSAKAAMCRILDGLGLNAIISDPATAKVNTIASIDSQNPKRLNLQTTVQLSGNTNILSVDLFFGFFFGTPAIVG